MIFGLGIILNGFPWYHWATLRIPGVLQRIAVCYLLAAIVYLFTSTRVQAVITAALLLGYWLVMTVVPVPGYGAGDLSPAGNLAAYIDRAVLGPHIWQYAKVYDPEGILSTLPAIATALLGVLTGTWLRSGRGSDVVAGRLVIAGIGGIAAGALWGLWFPINKSLWTSSYVVFTAGLALIVLAACYWLVEARAQRRWAIPFAVLGVNALVLFFLSTLAARLLVDHPRRGRRGRVFRPCCSTACSRRWPRRSTRRSPSRRPTSSCGGRSCGCSIAGTSGCESERTRASKAPRQLRSLLYASSAATL